MRLILAFVAALAVGSSALAREAELCIPKPAFTLEKGAAMSEAAAQKQLDEKLSKVTGAYLVQIDSEVTLHKIPSDAGGVLIRNIDPAKSHKLTIRNDRKKAITAFWFSFRDQGANRLIARSGFYGWTADPLKKPCPYPEDN